MDERGRTVEAQETAINSSDLRGKVVYQDDEVVFRQLDDEVIELGGREIDAIFTPGHTDGSTTFFDKARHYGFSGGAFGTTNLLQRGGRAIMTRPPSLPLKLIQIQS